MTPTDPTDPARHDLSRLRAFITAGSHWIFATDDPRAAESLRRSASGALFIQTVVVLTDRREAFPVAVLAVSKQAWPRSAAIRVAEAAVDRRGPRLETALVRDGADLFPISQNPERLTIVLAQILSGGMTAHPPAGMP